ncbi:glycoside hydrolase domain-containing protein [Desulfogranum japonicum]|uniref:glycoside hydrolase domain-containing protein n=1 Tax=Desulfogranum japonicum TaxID=231447 RepID=UPI0003FB3166|nr:fibronectin type III domain-containing protein [Desulfogranum japonicum]
MSTRSICIALFLALAKPACAAWLDRATVDIVLNTEDNQFAFYSGPSTQTEWLINNGGKSTIRLKGYDDPSAMQWDLSAYQGKVIEAAELHLAKANSDAINALVVSTINSDWTEGHSYGSVAGSGEPCWRWRSYPDGEWTYPGSDFSTATFGNFGTLVSFGYKHNDTFKEYTSDGQTWIAMQLDPAILYAMIQDNYGLVVTDPRFGSANGNPTIYSSEQNSTVQPRLYIKLASIDDITPPGAVAGLEAQAGDWNGEAVLRFTAPTDPDDGKAFGYTVRYATYDNFSTATNVERWRIPRPGEAGTTDSLLLEDLNPGTTYYFWVQAYDKVGNSGPVAMTTLTVPPALATPAFADGDFPVPDPTGKQIAHVSGILQYWACSELAKINPATGNRLTDGYSSSGDDAYKKANAVWNAATKTITLKALRNEVVGFQVILERLLASLTDVSLEVSDLHGPNGAIIAAAENIDRFKLHYTSGSPAYPDPAIPLSAPFSETLDIPDADSNPGGTFQSIWSDIYVPRDTAPGTYTGTVTVDCNELSSPVTMQIQLLVASPVIPDSPTFFIDLNGYGNKWENEASRYQVFQLTHRHRMVPNTLPYSWGSTWVEDRAPILSGTGPSRQISDWSTFATNYGPFFDGSAFSPDHPVYPYHGPGENTAIANFYTTGYEGWPLSIADTTYGYDEITGGKGHSYWNSLVDSGGTSLQTFWLEAPDVMEAFPSGYMIGTRNVWKQFAQYAQDHGWTTTFQFYLNNKYSYSTTNSLWTLEEQYVADDFRADAFFMGLFKEGWEEANAPDTKFQARIDTSSRWQQNWGQLKGICNLRVQGAGRNWDYRHDRYRRYIEQQTEQRWWYGTGPKRTDALTDHGAEFLTHWSHGLDGGTPYWENYTNDWTASDTEDATLSILLSGSAVPGHGSYEGRVATIRMKGMRYGQQLVEMLNMAADTNGWNRNRVARALSARYGDNAGDDFDGFGGDSYTGMQILDFYKLHADLIATLENSNGIGENDAFPWLMFLPAINRQE